MKGSLMRASGLFEKVNGFSTSQSVILYIRSAVCSAWFRLRGVQSCLFTGFETRDCQIAGVSFPPRFAYWIREETTLGPSAGFAAADLPPAAGS